MGKAVTGDYWELNDDVEELIIKHYYCHPQIQMKPSFAVAMCQTKLPRKCSTS